MNDWRWRGTPVRLARHTSLPSTSTWLTESMRQAGPDAPPQVVVAERQTAGRGRMGRSWEAPPGASLAFSLGVTPPPGTRWDGLSIAIGLALAEAFDPTQREAPRLRVKWPNDLLLLDAASPSGVGRKVMGLLVETLGWPGDDRRGLVIGCGINLQSPFDPALARPVDASSPWGRASLRELDPRWDAATALEAAVPALLTVLQGWTEAGGGMQPWQAAFARRDALAGYRLDLPDDAQAAVQAGVQTDVQTDVQADVQTHAPTARPAAGWRAAGLADDGALRLVDDDGRVRIVHAGEVRLRPLAAASGAAREVA